MVRVWAMALVTLGLVVGAAATAPLTAASSDGGKLRQAEPFAVELRNWGFQPGAAEVPEGRDVAFVNRDAVDHVLAVGGRSDTIRVPAGGRVVVALTQTHTTYRCIHLLQGGHDGMVGVVHIVEADAADTRDVTGTGIRVGHTLVGLRLVGFIAPIAAIGVHAWSTRATRPRPPVGLRRLASFELVTATSRPVHAIVALPTPSRGARRRAAEFHLVRP